MKKAKPRRSKQRRRAENRSRIKAILTPEPSSAREGGQSNPVQTPAGSTGSPQAGGTNAVGSGSGQAAGATAPAIASADETAAMATRIMWRTEGGHPETALRAANLLMSLCGYEKRPQRDVPRGAGYSVIDLLREALGENGA